MLFVLIGFMLLASACLLCLKKDRALWFLLGMCGSLMIQFSGILIFIAKKGGYSKDILRFLFFSTRLKMKAQYLYITLDALGYMIGVGRYLFPVFLLELALHYSMLPLLRRRPSLSLWALVLPTASLICYYPPLFRAITRLWPWAHNVLVQGCYFWIIAYVAAALLLLLQELFAITIHFCKRQFAYIVLYLIALSGLYLLYCGQDPAQVYRFYSYDYIWNKGVGYLQYAPSIGGYTILVVVNVICGSLGFFSLMNYTRDTVLDGIEETGLERRFDIARTYSYTPSRISFWLTACLKSACSGNWKRKRRISPACATGLVSCAIIMSCCWNAAQNSTARSGANLSPSCPLR